MCGRIACMLDPETICRACSYKDEKSGKFSKPVWKEHPAPGSGNETGVSSMTYYPSANIPPTRFTPVMIKGTPTKEEEELSSSDYVIMPMMFGLIPSYHKGEAKSHGLTTNNARIEGILESRLYKPVLNKRKLCVIVMQGFYEWKTVGAEPKGKKQPYLIFSPQDENVKVAENSSWDSGVWTPEEGWKGPKILKMAGLYDVWKSPAGDTVYSYTVITMASTQTLSWLHDRTPAILETDEQVQAWLNASEKTDNNELLSILTPPNSLQWYQVESKVGNVKCRDDDCMKPMEVKEKKPTAMDLWLKKSEKKKSEDDDEGPADKKPKLEKK